MKKKVALEIAEKVRLTFVELIKIRGGGPEGDPEGDDAWSKSPGKP